MHLRADCQRDNRDRGGLNTPQLTVILWDITADHGIAGATAGITGYYAFSGSDGKINVGSFNPGTYTLVVNLPTGYGKIRWEYPVIIDGVDIVQTFNYEEAQAQPQPTPSGEGGPVENYHGFDIYQRTDTLKFYYFIAGVRSEYFDSIAEARGSILSYIESQTPTQPVTPSPSTTAPAPSDLGWLQGIADWFGNLWKWKNDYDTANLNSFKQVVDSGYSKTAQAASDQSLATKAVAGALGSIGDSIGTAISNKTNEIVQKAIGEALASLQTSLPGAVGNSPEWKVNIENTLNPYANQIVDAVLAECNPSKFAHSPITPEEAKNALNVMEAGIVAVEVGLFIANAALEGATLGQVEAIKELETLVLSKLGLSTIGSAAVTIPITELVLKKAQQYYAHEYTPEIPGYGDLINMRVKEKITQEAFTDTFAYLGFEKKWADLIWDAHFSAPGLNDILTAWRRGEITEERVDELMILVDLDPFYKQIFDTRKYVDPSLSLARFMFETGSINEARVKEIVHRNGFRPDDEESLTNFVVHFQERRYRQRYLTALGTGYARGVVTVDELNKAVLDAGYSQGTADWIVKSSDIRKDIAARGTKATGPKLLAIGDLKKAYVNSIMDENTLRTELQLRDYQTTDIQTLIDVLNLDKEEAVVGKRVIALSPTEMINAYHYGVWTEDQLRTELMVRGLSLDEVNTLIATKKAQWGVSP